jgi:hypothetical protein
VIKFEITYRNYKLKDTGIVLIEVLDFNKKDMILGTGKNALRFAGNNLRSSPLSSVPLQVSLSILDLQLLFTSFRGGFNQITLLNIGPYGKYILTVSSQKSFYTFK